MSSLRDTLREMIEARKRERLDALLKYLRPMLRASVEAGDVAIAIEKLFRRLPDIRKLSYVTTNNDS